MCLARQRTKPPLASIAPPGARGRARRIANTAALRLKRNRSAIVLLKQCRNAAQLRTRRRRAPRAQPCSTLMNLGEKTEATHLACRATHVRPGTCTTEFIPGALGALVGRVH